MFYRLDKHLTTALFAPIVRRSTPDGIAIPILMYHSVSDDPEREEHPYFWVNTTPERFESQMRFLRENAYNVIGLAEAVDLLYGPDRGPGKNPRRVVVTFDDGFKDFKLNAFPMLRELGFTATVFLPTNYITDRTRKMDGKEHLSWEDVSELHGQGISFGSHTAGHLQLKNLNMSEMQIQIRNSKDTIENRLGARIDSFSYPYAFPEEDKKLTKSLCDVLAGCGYRYGVTTRIGRATQKDPVFFLKRLPVSSRDDLGFFSAKLDGGYDWLYRVQLMSKILRAKFRNGKKRE